MIRRNALRAILLAAVVLAQARTETDFKERAMAHVRQLAVAGGRVAGEEGEAKAGRYIKEQFEQMGLPVVVEPFQFQSYALSSKKPAALVSLTNDDFRRLKTAGARSGEVACRGKVVTASSANIVATLGPGTGREIVISAHYDSWKGPGANDNASGVAVLLELAREFRSIRERLPVTLRFVAFGAEEVGMVGAQAYLEKHESDLARCQLLFNIDSVGGSGPVYMETRDGVRNVPPKVQNQIPRELSDKASGDIGGRWMPLSPALGPLGDSSNVPEWLRSAVADTGKELGVEIRSSRNMGSDHRVFVQAGVVATNIAISGSGSHTSADTPESLNPGSLGTAARIVGAVVRKAVLR